MIDRIQIVVYDDQDYIERKDLYKAIYVDLERKEREELIVRIQKIKVGL